MTVTMIKGDKDMVRLAAQQVAYARRRCERTHPEYSEAWAIRLDRLQAWHQALLGKA